MNVKINCNLLTSLVIELILQANEEPFWDSITSYAGDIKINGVNYQLQLTIESDEDNFLDSVVEENIFEGKR